MPHGITPCYLPPGRGDIPALTPAEGGTRLSDPGGMQGRVESACTDKRVSCIKLAFVGVIETVVDGVVDEMQWDARVSVGARVLRSAVAASPSRAGGHANGVVNATCAMTHYQHTHTRYGLTALFPGLPGWAGTRKIKPIWNLLKQQTVSGSGISWAICNSAPRSRQITMSAPDHSVFYRPGALPAAQPTASKH